jgi:ABC-type multidrug transport system fused ATPase/permease subunit
VLKALPAPMQEIPPGYGQVALVRTAGTLRNVGEISRLAEVAVDSRKFDRARRRKPACGIDDAGPHRRRGAGAADSGWGQTVVLNAVSLTVTPGGTLAILGRNGAGKTTLFATLMGLTTLHGGTILMDGRAIDTLPTHRRARPGLGYVSQEREIFSSLTVMENLVVA